MKEFKLQYLVLGTLLLASIGGSLSTPLGVDSRVGNISAGIAIGVMFAIAVLRTIDLKKTETARIAHLDFHGSRTVSLIGSVDAADAPSVEPVVEEPVAEEPVEVSSWPAPTKAPSNLVQFDTPDIPIRSLEISGLEKRDRTSLPICSCACGCEWRSKGGMEELCGNCVRWWQQQSLRCTCDSVHTDFCTCGAVKHRPYRPQVSITKSARVA